LPDRLYKTTYGFVKLDSEELMKEIFKVSSSLSQKIIGKRNFEKQVEMLESMFEDRFDEMDAYIKELLPTVQANPKSALNQIIV